MALALAGSAAVHTVLVPFLDLYDIFWFAAASRQNYRWAQSSPWYRELYWITPVEYVDMRMYLPHRMFRSIKKFRLNWWSDAGIDQSEREDGTLSTISRHMEYVTDTLPHLETVEVAVTLTGRFEPVDPGSYRLDDLLIFLDCIAHIKELVLDLRGTADLELFELKSILNECFSHEVLSLALRSSEPSATNSLRESQKADAWLLAIAPRLGRAESFLQCFRLHLEVPFVGPAQVICARKTSLKVSQHVANALDGQLVRYSREGSVSLKNTRSENIPMGPFYACRKGQDSLQLLDSEDSMQRYKSLKRLGGSPNGRQNFMADDSAGLGKLSTIERVRGIATFEEILRGRPDLNVELNGENFWNFADLRDVNSRAFLLPRPPYTQHTDMVADRMEDS